MKSFMVNGHGEKGAVDEGRTQSKAILTEGMELYEKYYSKRYPKLGEMFDDPSKSLKAAQTAIMLENQAQYLNRLDETTILAKFGDIAPRILDILRISYPNQVAHELVDVQTMKSTHDNFNCPLH